jgi:hypothetical protein
MRYLSISPQQLDACQTFQAFINEAPFFAGLPTFDATGLLMGRMIQCGGQRLEAVLRAELQPVPANWVQSYVSFQHRQAYAERTRRMNRHYLHATRTMATTLEEHEALFGLFQWLIELTHAAESGRSHLLFILPAVMRTPVCELPPVVQPLAGFLQRQWTTGSIHGAVPVRAVHQENVEQFIELLDSREYADACQAHTALADQVASLNDLIATVEKTTADLIGHHNETLRWGDQKLGLITVEGTEAEAIRDMLPLAAKEGLFTALANLKQNRRRILFYDFDGLRLSLLRQRCASIGNSTP